MSRMTRAELARLIERHQKNLSIENEFVITHPVEMEPSEAIAHARHQGMPKGKIYFHPCFTLSTVQWRALI